MRIGIFTNAYRPDISGVVSSICTFREALIKQGHAVYIFAPETSDYDDEEYGIFRYPSINLSKATNTPVAIPVSPFVNWVVPRLKLDILHSQHPVLIGEEAVTFARHLNLPHVFTHHSQYESYARYIPINQNIVKTLTREVVRGHMARSVKVITPSKSIRDILSKQQPDLEDRFSIIPSPINLDAFKPATLNPASVRERYQLDGLFTFITVARLGKEKRYPLLFEAFRQVCATHSRARLLIVGDGPDREKLEQLAIDQGVMEWIIFAGSINHTEVPNYLAAADVFAFASTNETQGLVLAEGMAAGIPAVAIDAPGCRDVIDHEVNGLLMQDSGESLASGMLRLMEDRALRDKLAEGARQTASGYGPTILTRSLVDLYQEAIAKYAQEPINYKRFASDGDLALSRRFPPQWLNDLTEESVDSISTFWNKISETFKFDFDD